MDAKKEILEIMTAKDEPVSVRFVSDHVDAPYEKIYGYLETMARNGEVQKISNSKNGRVAYLLAEKNDGKDRREELHESE